MREEDKSNIRLEKADKEDFEANKIIDQEFEKWLFEMRLQKPMFTSMELIRFKSALRFGMNVDKNNLIAELKAENAALKAAIQSDSPLRLACLCDMKSASVYEKKLYDATKFLELNQFEEPT